MTTYRVTTWRWVLAGLMTICLAFGAGPPSVPSAPLVAAAVTAPQEPPPSDLLWVAIVDTRGMLIPIARKAGGVWDHHWPNTFEVGRVARIDSDGVLRTSESGQGLKPWALPVDAQDPEFPRIGAPTRWSFHSETAPSTTLTVTGLDLIGAHCLVRWALRTNDTDDRRLSQVDGTRQIAGVAFNRRLEAISGEEVPYLDRIRTDLELVDDPSAGRSEFVWLGFYRLERGGIIGVVNRIGYEGESYLIVEIEGDKGQVVIEVSGGGC